MALSLTAGATAQSGAGGQSFCSMLAEKNILNHMDVGVNVGTLGIGIDVAVPVGDYVRVRAGYNYMPRFNINTKFEIGTSNGGSIQKFIDKKDRINYYLDKFEIDLDDPEFSAYKSAVEHLNEVALKDYVTMGLKPNLHQFKFLVDVLPFKNNKHWSFTAGFFVGPSDVGDAINNGDDTRLLQFVNSYNTFYTEYLANGRNFAGHGEVDKLTEIFTENGMAGFSLGKFADGDLAMMRPGDDGRARAEMRVNKFRPYLGFGYNTHLSRDKKWNMNVDAGILFLCGAPSVYVDNVYKIDKRWGRDAWNTKEEWEAWKSEQIDPSVENYDIVRYNEDFDYEIGPTEDNQMYLVDKPLNHVDMVHDLHDIPGKVGNMVNTISKFKVYPNASVTFTYRLF